MAFELEHDWQQNLATPRARIGERAKTRLLILLCTVWICIGLLGHQPWKPDEAQSISIIKNMLQDGNIAAPMATGDIIIQNPPLYYLTATGMATLLSPILPLHDGARLATGLWMALTLLMVGMTGRELWGWGAGRQTTFIFLGSVGLVVTAHLLMTEVAALAGVAMGLYALALAKRRPFRASGLLGSSIGICFLSSGVYVALIPLTTALALPLLFSNWRDRSFAIVLGLSLLLAAPWLVIWPLWLWYSAPAVFHTWWQNSLQVFSTPFHGYFLNLLAWYAWPALPIALWGLWRYRAVLFQQREFQLLIVFFVAAFVFIGFSPDDRGIYAMPLLLPLAALAGGSIETLRRGAASALDWFGLILFGFIGFLIWLGWFAMMSGWPAKLAERMHKLSGLGIAEFSWLGFIPALLVTCIWFIVINNPRRSNRSAVTDWAVGMTMAWSLLMTLWLPWIDSARSYKDIMLSIQKALPASYTCMNSSNLGSAQTALLDYYTGIRTLPVTAGQGPECDIYLIQDERKREKIQPGPEWQLIWQGKRAADRRESFRLYQR
ncbi:MAG TPA: glycosyl transferase [Methylophilaceae bacterium]|nr:glycosyl transferase [Methylophilaceae bacterium]